MEPNLGVVVHARGDLRLTELPEPTPAADQAVVAIEFGGICGSDLHYWQHGAAGESLLREPMLLGHEVVGTVIQPAADGSGPAVGARVAVHPATPGPGDGSRYPEGSPNLSPGSTYLGSAARFPHTGGAFARRVALPSRMFRVLPPGIRMQRAALVEPASVAWHAVGRGGDVAGQRALVIGCGPIGLLTIAVLARAGASDIIAVDMFDGPLRRGRESGATRTIVATDADAIARADADLVIEASGSPRGLASAVRAATRGGRVVMVGLLPSGEQPALISLAITRELDLRGSFRFNDEIVDVIDALADDSLHVDAVVSHILPVDDALAAFETARDSQNSAKVLIAF